MRLAALTVIVVQPSGGVGSGRSPTTRPDSGSSEEKASAYTANMQVTLSKWGEGTYGVHGRDALTEVATGPAAPLA